MSSLFVLLPPSVATAHTEFEYLVSADGRQVARQGAAAPALLPPPSGAGSEVVAIAPASALSWHRIELPKGAGPRSPRLRAILEGLLEDRLLDDPDAVHFALQPRPPAAGPVWVAVCDRAWLRAALSVLEAAGRPASRVVPEFTPDGEPTLYALGEPPDHARLVCAGRDGIHLLPLSTASLPLLPALAEGTAVIAEPAVAGLAEQVLQQVPRLQQPGERHLAAAQGAWDLAQLEFASSGRTRAIKKLSGGWADLWRAPRWRPARWAAAVLVVAQLVGLNAWAWRERSALAAKREASQALLTRTFPNVRVVVDAPRQMEREVAALRQSAGGVSGGDLEAMLGALATVAPAGTTLTGVEFTNGELRLRSAALPPGQLQPLGQALKALGYAARAQGDLVVIRPEQAP